MTESAPMPLYSRFTFLLKKYFPYKMQKISLNAGFICPNRDGTKGPGGCTYCNNQTPNPEYYKTEKSVTRQFKEGKQFFVYKYPDMKYLAYFQTCTNAYDELEGLKRKYGEALSVDSVVGLVIGIRPGCMSDPLLYYPEELNKRSFFLVEYSIEATRDATLKRINQGRTYADTVEAIQRTATCDILTGGHIILSLPGESREKIIAQAIELSRLPLATLRMHQLQLICGTKMVREFELHPEGSHLFSAGEYIDLIVDYVKHLRPNLILERFVSQSPKELLIAPGWGLKNYEFTARAQKRMKEKGTYQGKAYSI